MNSGRTIYFVYREDHFLTPNRMNFPIPVSQSPDFFRFLNRTLFEMLFNPRIFFACKIFCSGEICTFRYRHSHPARRRVNSDIEIFHTFSCDFNLNIIKLNDVLGWHIQINRASIFCTEFYEVDLQKFQDAGVYSPRTPHSFLQTNIPGCFLQMPEYESLHDRGTSDHAKSLQHNPQTPAGLLQEPEVC